MPNISSREEEVLRLIAFEHTSSEIAEALYISKHTAISHRKNLLKKFQVRNVAGLVRRGFELGILNSNSSQSAWKFFNTNQLGDNSWTRSALATVLIIIVQLFLIIPEVNAQVTNGEINWEVKVLDYNYTGQTEPGLNNSQNQDEPTFLLHANDVDQPIETDMLGNSFFNRPCMTGIPNDPHPGVDTSIAFNNCYPVDDIFCFDILAFKPSVGMTIDRAICRSADSLIMGIYAFEDDSYDNATGQPNTFGPERYVCSENFNQGSGTPDTELINQRYAQVLDGHGVNQFIQYNVSGGSAALSLLSVYTYVNGNTRNHPLDFGQIPYGATRNHRNSGYDDGLCIPFGEEGTCNLGGNPTGYDFNWNIGEKTNSDGGGTRYYTFTVPADGALIDIDVIEEDGPGSYVALYRSGPSSGSLLAATTFGIDDLAPISICKKHPNDTDDTEFTTYTIEIQYHGEFVMQISAAPTSGCLDNVENTFSNTTYNVDFGLPDRTSCATGNSPFQTFENMTLANLKDDIDALIANSSIAQFHVLDKDEASLNGLFVQSKGTAIALSKTVRIYHYRQQLGAGTASDVKDFFLLEESTISAGTEFLAKNYIITPPTGSRGDAIVFEIFTGAGTNRLVLAAPLLVTGVDIVSESLGQTVIPSQVDMILYDPPGAGSSAGFSQEFSVCREVTSSISKTDGSSGSVELKLGIKGSIGFLAEIEYELSTSFNQDVSVTKDSTKSRSFRKCTKVSTSFSTKTDINRIGENGDIFIGTGEQWVWGFQDSIGLDGSCNLISDTAFIAAIESFSQFAWDRVKVEQERQELQGAIDSLSALIMANPNIDEAVKLDKTRKEEQLRVWNEIMTEYQNKRNDRDSNRIPDPDGSFDWAGANLSKSLETQVSTSRSVSTNIDFDKSIGQDFVATLGASGVEGGYRILLGKEFSASISSEESTTRTISYDYSDGAGDSHVGVITRDPDFGTHIFHLDNSSKTSCPYEGGTRRDQPSIAVSCSPQGPFKDNIYLENLNANNEVTLYVQVCNNNQLEGRNTSWRLFGNTRNIAYQFNGQSGQQIMNLGILSAGSCDVMELTFDIDNNTGSYDGLTFHLYPACLEDYETGLLNELDDMVVNLTYGGSGNYPAGMVDDCGGCVDILDLDAASGALNGPYSASSKIRLLPGVQINPGSNITLNAPEVEMQEADVPGTTVLTVSQIGCQN